MNRRASTKATSKPAARVKLVALLLFIVLMMGVGVVARWVSGTREGAIKSLVHIGAFRDRVLRILECDRAGVWLSAETQPDRGEVRSIGITAALAARVASVIRVESNGSTSESRLGRGLIGSFASAPDGTRWAVLLEGDPDNPRSHTFVSADGGASWHDYRAPSDIVGLAFETRERGYSWSRSRVYRTTDGGDGWNSVEVGRLHVSRGPTRRPILSREEMWMPLNAESESDLTAAPPAAGLIVVRPDLSKSLIATWDADSIEGVAPDGRGGALALLMPLAKGGYRVERVEAARSAGSPTVVHINETRSPAGFLSRGAAILIHEVAFDPRAHPFENPTQAVAVSADNGRTWTSYDITAERPDSVCLTEEGFWAVRSGHDAQLVFHAWQGRLRQYYGCSR
jgi:hypothetical protein